jgi:hypothetical protein
MTVNWCHLSSLYQTLGRVAVDTQRHVMYVGLEKGTVGVFELTYELV